jgi:hypothetical protein
VKKIPTVLVRDPDDRAHVLDEVNPGCEWVLAGEGVATRKYDGTCVMLDDDGRWWARREVKKGKAVPANYVPEDFDEVTGKTQGWEPIEQSPFVKFWREAVEPMNQFGAVTGRMPPVGTYELIGPKINGNPERATSHRLERHVTAEIIGDVEPTVEGIKAHVRWLGEDGVEGIVWHHPDGRMAKLKARDLPKKVHA